jgi:Ca2+-binding EF-hand superfamily protein
MKKSINNPEDLLENMDQLFNIIDKAELGKLNPEKLKKVIKKLNKNIKEKSPDNLDV